MIFLGPFTYGQGDLLLVSNEKCQVVIDGDLKYELESDSPVKIELSEGEHWIFGKSEKRTIDKTVEIENDKQTILRLEFKSKLVDTASKLNIGLNRKNKTNEDLEPEFTSEVDSYEDFAQVADLGLTLSSSGFYSSSRLQAEQLYLNRVFYAFDSGDSVLLNVDFQKDAKKKKKEKNNLSLSVMSYSNMSEIYFERDLYEIKNKIIKIEKKGIYLIQITDDSLLNRDIRLTIKRKSEFTKGDNFNVNVVKKQNFEVKEIEKSSVYLNSSSNEMFKGGTNEITIPINLPPNTVRWYYSFSASRDNKDIQSNLKNVSLFKKLTKAVNGIDPTTTMINVGVQLLASPPGANYCSVYLLDLENQRLFRNDDPFSYIISGSRENLKSSTINADCCTDNSPYFLGIKNNDLMHGIHVGIEIVAITQLIHLEYE